MDFRLQHGQRSVPDALRAVNPPDRVRLPALALKREKRRGQYTVVLTSLTQQTSVSTEVHRGRAILGFHHHSVPFVHLSRSSTVGQVDKMIPSAVPRPPEQFPQAVFVCVADVRRADDPASESDRQVRDELIFGHTGTANDDWERRVDGPEHVCDLPEPLKKRLLALAPEPRSRLTT